MTTATVQAGYVICTGACGSGKAGITRHRSDSAIGQVCGMGSQRRSRKLGTGTSHLASVPTGVQENQNSWNAPDWNNQDVLDNAVESMMTHYRDTYGEDSDAFRLTKKYRNEIDYRLKAGLKEKEPSAEFDDFANKFLHDPKLQELIQEDYSTTEDEAKASILELESRIRHPQNIVRSHKAAEEAQKETRLLSMATEYDSIQTEIDEFNARMEEKFERQAEIKAEFKKEAIEFSKKHKGEWLVEGPVQARFTPNTVLLTDKAEEVIPKNQRKALLKPEELDPKLVRGWIENNKKLDIKDFTAPGSGAFSIKVVHEDEEGK